jgi:hypothetical protein
VKLGAYPHLDLFLIRDEYYKFKYEIQSLPPPGPVPDQRISILNSAKYEGAKGFELGRLGVVVRLYKETQG